MSDYGPFWLTVRLANPDIFSPKESCGNTIEEELPEALCMYCVFSWHPGVVWEQGRCYKLAIIGVFKVIGN